MGIVYDDEPPTAGPPTTAPPVVQYDEPSSSAAPAVPDKYQQAAIAERTRLQQAGVQLPEGYTRRLMEGPLLGWGGEIAAGMMTPLEMARQGTFDPREGYRYAKAREDLVQKVATEKTGLLGDVTEGVGGLATLPGNVFGKQAAAALGGGQAGIAGVAGRMAGYGAEAGMLGAIQGAGTAQTVGDIPSEAGRGFAMGSVLGAPFGAFANVAQRSTAIVPAEDELFNLGKRAYRARDKLPVSYSTEKVAANVLDPLNNANWQRYGRDAPQTIGKLSELSDQAAKDVAAAKALNPNPPGALTAPGQISAAPNPWEAVIKPRDVASMRREIYEAGATGSPTDTRAGTVASKVVDRVLTRPDPALLSPGTDIRDAVAAAKLDAAGRGNFAGGYRSQAVTEAINKSLDVAGGQHSGLNFENILRQNLRQARSKEAFGTLNTTEEAALENLIRGTVKANSIREFGNMLGGGGGLGRMAAIGGGSAGGGALASYYYGGDPWVGAAGGLALGMTGRGLRQYGNRQAQQGAETFSDLIRKRTPEYRARAAVAPTEIGPGLGPYSPAAATSKVLTLGGGGGIRDALAASLLYNTTGQRPPWQQ